MSKPLSYPMPAPVQGPARSPKPMPDCIHEIFEQQAKRAPNRIALTFNGESITYGRLNALANRLAHSLRTAGVHTETPVAIYLDRSPDLVIAILATLKAGGCYVPIDLTYPRDRIGFILQDTAAPVLLTESRLLGALPETAAEVICLEAFHLGMDTGSFSNLAGGATRESAAYIIYTSGSTGKPKGVIVTHRNVVRLLQSTEPWFGFSMEDVWALFHSCSFDMSVWELWGALFFGGRLVIVPHLTTRSPVDFYELLAREKVTFLNQTPSAFRQLIWAEGTAPRQLPLSLRFVTCGGEALVLDSLKPWFDRHGDTQPVIVNMYGITETTVHTTYRPICRADLSSGAGSVIGVPIPDLQVYLLDEQLQPVKPGEPGEIFVGGAGVARGYLRRAELTSQRFLPDPFRNESGARLYRSGDLARINDQGEMEYLGRMDHQVKIRGFRVELGEIESALNRHPAIRASLVLAGEEPSDNKRLIAYVVPMDPKAPRPDLRSHLARMVPDYMLPAVFVYLQALPLTNNGKIDRTALPPPPATRPELSAPAIPPRTPAEAALALIWAEVLQLESVGVEDNFFELGGDSIRCIALLGKARQQGWALTLEDLFKTPTVAGLAGSKKDTMFNGGSAQAHEPNSTVPGEPANAPERELLSVEDHAQLPADAEDAYPISRLQLGMFFHNEFDPLSAIYHDVFSFRVQVPFNRAHFEAALSQVSLRHPILRTSFHLAGFSVPLQIVHRRAPLPLTVEDVSNLAPQARSERLARWIETEKRNPFDREAAPLMRCHLQLHGVDSFQLIISFHHACIDGWSLAALVTELLQDYSSLLRGLTPSTPPPSARYRDFIAAEHAAIVSADSRRFWADKLKEAVPHPLPRWPRGMCAGGHEQQRSREHYLTPEVLEGLKSLARRAGVPLKTVLLAAHQRVLGALHGHSEIITGLVSNGRPEAKDGEKVLGLFLNTVPLRQTLQLGSWLDLVRETFQAEQEILPHRRFPLSEIQRLLADSRCREGVPGQHGTLPPLFETAFDFVHFHVYKELQYCGGLAFAEGQYFEANNLTAYTTFMLDTTSTRLELHIDYDPNALCAEQVEQMCGYYLRTIHTMAADPFGACLEFSPLSETETQRLLVDWNDTRRDYPSGFCVHELFAAQARQKPDQVAIVCGRESLTFGQLDERATVLAAHLQKLQVQPGTLVGVCLPRSVDLVAGLLAILKTGAAYLPFDPNFPSERTHFMIEDSRVQVILTHSTLRERFVVSEGNDSGDAGTHPALLCADELRDTANPFVPPTLSPAALAYVIFTSGSTGKPKAVQVEHRSVVNLLYSAAQTISFSRAENLLAVTTLSFDIAGLEIFLPLLFGARLTLAPHDAMVDAQAMRRVVEDSGATVMQATPALWQLLIEAGWQGSADLKIIVGGDVLKPHLAAQLLDRCASAWNFYGPTETTIWSTAWKVQRSSPVLIGRPLANTQVYILNDRLQPVPTGSPGELYIGGDGLARGYLNRPALTAEKFIAGPFGSRLYRTGDLARFLPEGDIELLGRLDQQVKIRGFRIEPGEIETVLRQHPGIVDALITAHEDAHGDARLVGYLITRNGPPPVSDLREFIRSRLPHYMVPAQFVLLKKFPLTPNGKVNVRGLPDPETHAQPPTAYAAPRHQRERTLAQIWCEVLSLKQVGIDDHFFELGGDSLSATRAFARVNQVFGIELTLREFFENPTVRELAAWSNRQFPSATKPASTCIRRQPRLVAP